LYVCDGTCCTAILGGGGYSIECRAISKKVAKEMPKAQTNIKQITKIKKPFPILILNHLASIYSLHPFRITKYTLDVFNTICFSD